MNIVGTVSRWSSPWVELLVVCIPELVDYFLALVVDLCGGWGSEERCGGMYALSVAVAARMRFVDGNRGLDRVGPMTSLDWLFHKATRLLREHFSCE